MSASAEPAYSALDRALHRLAFGSQALQGVLADLERSLYAKEWRGIDASRPVFITSLPRAGTTILLQALARAGGLASHTYRDMPFVLTPVIWQRAARLFGRTSAPQQRAHGDGLEINEDSPEAFEEVLWLKHFPGYFDQYGIECWRADAAGSKFAAALTEHMQKVILLRCGKGTPGARYVSKNNANIARMAYLQKLYPGAQFVVPVRQPLEQAVSLMRQHRNFTAQHAGNAFTRRYMADIGHFEFGELHRPILFDGFWELAGDRGPESVDYWLAYWIAAYGGLAGRPGVLPVSFEGICADPGPGLCKLFAHLGVKAEERGIADAARLFRAPPSPRRDDYGFEPDLVENATGLYRSLLDGAVA